MDFFEALSDGSISIGLLDYDWTYDVQYKDVRLDGAKGSQVTFQYHQTHVAEQDAPWTKKYGNSVKKDQLFIHISGIPDSWDSTQETDCFKLMAGVLPTGFSTESNFAKCAGTQKDTGY